MELLDKFKDGEVEWKERVRDERQMRGRELEMREKWGGRTMKNRPCNQCVRNMCVLVIFFDGNKIALVVAIQAAQIHAVANNNINQII